MAEARIIITALALVVAMVLAGWIGRRQRAGAVVLALLGIAWLTVDHDFEGGVLFTVTEYHGLVTSDLVGLAAIGTAIWLWLRVTPSRPTLGVQRPFSGVQIGRTTPRVDRVRRSRAQLGGLG